MLLMHVAGFNSYKRTKALVNSDFNFVYYFSRHKLKLHQLIFPRRCRLLQFYPALKANKTEVGNIVFITTVGEVRP